MRSLIVQAKLTVGPVGDRFEREADAVADRVVRSIAKPDAAADPAPAPGTPRLQRSSTIGAAGGEVNQDTDREIRRQRGGGSALPAPVRRTMETAIGADFSGIRVHEGPTARALNERIQAKAFTVGGDVFFRDGMPDVSGRDGQHLLAHELAHTVQQGAAAVGRVQRSAAPRPTTAGAQRHAAPLGRVHRALSRNIAAGPHTIRRQWDPAHAPALTTLLKAVSGKDAALMNALSDPEKESVKAYLENGATDTKAVKKLLHFGKKTERGQTIDAAQRVTIRSKLLVFVARGGSLPDATAYRAQWLGLSVGHLGDLRPVPSATGAMEMVPLLGGLRVPPENEDLTQLQVNQIRDVFDDVMQNVMYNSSAVPLDFMNEVRKAREVDPTARIADIFNTYAPNNPALTGAAGGADCVGMAERVRSQLAALGIGSHVIGTKSGNYLNQLPSHTNVRVGWQESKDYAIYSHASVVVPYLDPGTGEPRAIHIETGMGPDTKYFKSFVTLAEASGALSNYDTSTDVDPVELAKKHVKVKWRMYLSDSNDQASKVFIDLISGSVFLSKRPVSDVQGLQRLQDAGVFDGTSFNFENALATPDQIVTVTTDEGNVDLTNTEATELFFQLVAQNFGLPASFVPQMMYLAQHVDEFRQEAMLDPITTIRSTWAKREQALDAAKAAGTARGPKQRHDETKGLDSTADALMKEALVAVNGGDGALATQKYDQAIAIYDSIVQGASDPTD